MPSPRTSGLVSYPLRIVRRTRRTRANLDQFRGPGCVRVSALTSLMTLFGTTAAIARASDVSTQTVLAEPLPDSAASTPLVQVSEQSQRYWYGWEVALAGETGGALLSVALATHNVLSLQTWRTLFFYPVGIPTYVLGGPLVHLSNGNVGKGLISLGMNVTTPIAVGFIGEAIACSGSDTRSNCHTSGFFNSAAVAVLVVPLIDAAFLGWGETTTERTITTSATPWSEMRPLLQIRVSGQTLVGLAGRF